MAAQGQPRGFDHGNINCRTSDLGHGVPSEFGKPSK
jgi:hypothetical protein